MPIVVIIALFCLTCAWTVAGTSGASAQTSPEAEAGWQSDVEGLRHFAGLRCPDVIGAFYRIKVLEGDGSSIAACIYTGYDGITAVLRMHLQGTGRREAVNFSRSYKTAGFEPVKLSGAAASGISYKTGTQDGTTQCETLWHFAGAQSDYTLWMAYTLPAQEADIGPAVASFTEALARQN